MASERQIAANRRNARNSTGPRSTSGRKRASQNAFRHGLTTRISSAEFDREVETLARQIAGDTEDKITIEPPQRRSSNLPACAASKLP